MYTKSLSYALQRSFSGAKPGQKFLFFFGAPGVGKGTYAELLAKDFHFNKISTGDEIRNIIKGKAGNTFSPDLVKEIKGIVNSGKLVSDDIVINIIDEKVSFFRRQMIFWGK